MGMSRTRPSVRDSNGMIESVQEFSAGAEACVPPSNSDLQFGVGEACKIGRKLVPDMWVYSVWETLLGARASILISRDFFRSQVSNEMYKDSPQSAGNKNRVI